MKLRLLGTGGYHPSARRHTACLLLPESGILLDAGTGLFRLPRYLRTQHLDILLSHAHLDHVIGLTYLVGIMHRYPLERVRIYGDPQKLAAVREHVFSEHLFPVEPKVEWHSIDDCHDLAQGARLSWFPLEHPGGALGFRLDWPGHSLAYVTDTTAAEGAAYIDRIRGVDLLVHECYFPDGREEFAALTGHSCTTPVARVAAAAGVGALLLVHVDPASEDEDPVGVDQARRIFPNAQLGYDELEIAF